MNKKDLIMANKILKIFFAIILLFFIVILIKLELSGKFTHTEKTIQEVDYTTMEDTPSKVKINDFLEAKDLYNNLIIVVVTDLTDYGFYFASLPLDTGSGYFHLTQINKIIKQDTPEWNEIAIKYNYP